MILTEFGRHTIRKLTRLVRDSLSVVLTLYSARHLVEVQINSVANQQSSKL